MVISRHLLAAELLRLHLQANYGGVGIALPDINNLGIRRPDRVVL